MYRNQVGCLFSFHTRLLHNSYLTSLAYAELHMCIGLLMRRLGSRMELFQTTTDDVEIHFDRFVPTPKDGTQGIRVMIHAEE